MKAQKHYIPYSIGIIMQPCDNLLKLFKYHAFTKFLERLHYLLVILDETLHRTWKSIVFYFTRWSILYQMFNTIGICAWKYVFNADSVGLFLDSFTAKLDTALVLHKLRKSFSLYFYAEFPSTERNLLTANIHVFF